jgi:hypothetical protein
VKKISVYIISLLALLNCMPVLGQEPELPDDSLVVVPLKIRGGLEITGPVIYFIDKSMLSLEGFVSTDINEKISVILGGGYSDYNYSQYNYEFKIRGPFFEAGADLNLLRPEVALGKYWAGAGIHYGLTRFTTATPSFKHDNYWGSVSSSLSTHSNWGHYLEIAGGFRAELFRNISIGWLVSIRKMIYTGADKDLRPIYYPGYGSGGRTLSYGINYYISWNIPYRDIKVKIKPEPVEEPEEDEGEELPEDSSNLGRQRIGR